MNTHSYAFSRRSFLSIAAATMLVALTWGSAGAQSRPSIPPGGDNWVQRAAGGLSAAPAPLVDLLHCLVGPNVTVSNATLTGAGAAAGLFSGGAAVLGIDQGIVLSTGNVGFVGGPNIGDGTSQDNGLPGDPHLNALIPGFSTLDATILEFDFTCNEPLGLSFSYVFASEEYNEFVNSQYNDVFAFFVNGTTVAHNIAKVPAICNTPGIAVAINNVNCSNPHTPPLGPNCDCYRNNDLSDGGGAIATEMDGLTEVFFASTNVNPGVNHIKIAIADAGDRVLDSNVFIRCESFVCAPPPPTGACCRSDGSCIVTSQGDCQASGGSYQGDGILCTPGRCDPTRNDGQSWGRLKIHYR